MSTSANITEIQKSFPTANEHFTLRTARMFRKQDVPEGTDAFLRARIEEGQRVRRICQQLFLNQIREGMPPGMHPAEYIHTAPFKEGLTALQAFNPRGVLIKEDRGIDLRAMLVETLMQHPEGLANPDVAAELRQRIKSTFLANTLADRRSRYSEVIETSNEFVKELQFHIDTEGTREDVVQRFQSLQTEFKAHRLFFLSPGLELIRRAAPVEQALDDILKKTESTDNDIAKELRAKILKSLPRIKELLGKRPMPGDNMLEECQELLGMLGDIQKTLQKDSIRLPSILSEMAAYHSFVSDLSEEFKRQSDVDSYLKDYAGKLESRFTELHKEFVDYPPEIAKYGGMFKTFAGRVRARLDAVKNTEEKTDQNEVEAEWEYVQLVDTYLKLCMGPGLSFDGIDATHTIGFVDASVALLAGTAPDSLYTSDGQEKELLKELKAMRRPLVEMDKEALEDAGVYVGNRDYSFSLLLDHWSGALPQKQVAMERVIAGYSLVERITQAESQMAGEVAELFNQFRTGKLTDAQYEQKAQESYVRCWDAISDLRPELLRRVEKTVARALEKGFDEIPPLEADGREAFAILLEQGRRASRSEYDKYLGQQDQLWEEGFVEMPASWMMGRPVDLSSFSSLSDAELESRLAALGEAHTNAERLYQRLELEIVGEGSGRASDAGYQDLLRGLDRVGANARSKLEPSFKGVMSFEDGAISRNVHWKTMVSGEIDQMLTDIGMTLTDSMGQLQEFCVDYVDANRGVENTEQVIQRTARYLDMFSLLFVQKSETEEKNSPSLLK